MKSLGRVTRVCHCVCLGPLENVCSFQLISLVWKETEGREIKIISWGILFNGFLKTRN